jgi:transcription antitermination protein NusB
VFGRLALATRVPGDRAASAPATSRPAGGPAMDRGAAGGVRIRPDGGVAARFARSPGQGATDMGKRRKSRELGLQLLYQLELQGEPNPEPHFAEFWSRHPVEEDVRGYAETIVRGVKLHQAKIDELISQYAEHWEIDRMAVVDRNLLRAGIFELLWGAEEGAEVPPKVAINEALEVAKKFSTHESSRFINGVLDRIHKELRPSPEP